MGSAMSYVLSDKDLRVHGQQIIRVAKKRKNISEESQVGRSLADVLSPFTMASFIDTLDKNGADNESDEYELEEGTVQGSMTEKIPSQLFVPKGIDNNNMGQQHFGSSVDQSRKVSKQGYGQSDPFQIMQFPEQLKAPPTKNVPSNADLNNNTLPQQHKSSAGANAQKPVVSRAKTPIRFNRNASRGHKESSSSASGQLQKSKDASQVRTKKAFDKTNNPDSPKSGSGVRAEGSEKASAFEKDDLVEAETLGRFGSSKNSNTNTLEEFKANNKGLIEILARFKINEKEEFVELKYRNNLETQISELESDASPECLMQLELDLDSNGNSDAKKFIQVLPKLMNRFEGTVTINGYKISWDKEESQRLKIIGFDINSNPMVMMLNPKGLTGVKVYRSSTKFEVRGQSEFGPNDLRFIRVEGDRASELKIVASAGKLIVSWPFTPSETEIKMSA